MNNNLLLLLQEIFGVTEQLIPIIAHKNGQTQAVVVTNQAGVAQLHTDLIQQAANPPQNATQIAKVA